MNICRLYIYILLHVVACVMSSFVYHYIPFITNDTPSLSVSSALGNTMRACEQVHASYTSYTNNKHWW